MSSHEDGPPSPEADDPVSSGTDAAVGGGLIAELLVALALAAHRFAMYPSDHPSLESTAESAVRSASRVLAERGSIVIAVRDGALTVDAAAVDATNALFADLARRLQEHQIGAIAIRRGVTVDEFRSMLDALSREASSPDRALGMRPAHERPSWEHVLLQPVGYEFLHVGGGADDRTNGGGSLAEIESEFGQALDSGDASAAIAWLSRLVEELGWDRSDRAQGVRTRLGDRIGAVGAAVWSELMRAAEDEVGVEDGPSSGLDPRFRPARRLAVAMSRARLPLDATTHLSLALSRLPDPPLTPMLARSVARLGALGSEPELSGTEDEAGAAVLGVLERAVVLAAGVSTNIEPARWTGAGESVPGRAGGHRTPLSRPEAVRAVELCFRVDRGGAILERALERLIRSGDLTEVIDLLEHAPGDSRVAGAVEDDLFTPDRLRLLLSGEDVEKSSLSTMVNRMGDAALDALFDRLAGSESRRIRRKIFDCLTAMGERVSGTVMNYLEDPPWFVQRNMLALLQRMPTLPTGFSPLHHLDHEDSRVRREAFPLALRVPEARDEALSKALDDTDERIVRMALLELQDSVPDPVVPILIRRGFQEPRFPELASLAIRALGRSGHPEARTALAAQCMRGFEEADSGPSPNEGSHSASRSPTLAAAVTALATGWPDHPEVRRVMTAASSSSDPQVRQAASRAPASPEARERS